MSLVGAMIGTEGILAFSDRRVILNEKRGRYVDSEEGKIHKIPSLGNVLVLHGGDRGTFDTLKDSIGIEEFSKTEIEEIVGDFNRRLLGMSGNQSLYYTYIQEHGVEVIIVGFGKDKRPRIDRITTGPFSCSPLYQTERGYDIVSPLDESETKLRELMEICKPNLSFDELRRIARQVYDYTIELTVFVGGGLQAFTITEEGYEEIDV